MTNKRHYMNRDLVDYETFVLVRSDITDGRTTYTAKYFDLYGEEAMAGADTIEDAIAALGVEQIGYLGELDPDMDWDYKVLCARK